MNLKMKQFVLTCCFLTLASQSAAESAGVFGGTIALGAMVLDGANNLNPNSSARRLDDLSTGAGRETQVRVLPIPRLSWDTGTPGGTVLYLETDPPIDEAGGFAISLGGTYQLHGVGTFDASLFVNPFEEAWEDPYLIGTDRQETDALKYGARIGLRRVLGSGLRLELVYLKDDVDEDRIGDRISSLARDGAVYSFNANYSFHPMKNLEVRPRISLRRGDYDGGANSFDKIKADLELRYMKERLMISPRVFYSHTEYDEEHPIFGKKRENDAYGASLNVHYMAPFDWQNWSVMTLLSVSEGESNINFYDTEATTVGVFMNYHF